jgi:serine/threonine-protein kinase
MRLGRGTRVSVYRIESVLGEGGMGVVYRAWDEAVGRPVALKCLHTNLAGDPDIRRRFAREARVLRSYAHPNVIQVYDFVEFDYLLGIVMELVDGPSLVQYLSKWRGRMPLGEVREIFSGVLQAIGEGHNQGIVHRDLKPDNLMLRQDGSLALADFGVAKQVSMKITDTGDGDIVGTPYYLSPEQALGRPVDARSDLYCLGVLAYELLTGRKPYHASSAQELLNLHINAPVPLLPPEHQHLQAVMESMMAKDREQRYPSAQTLLDDLAGMGL